MTGLIDFLYFKIERCNERLDVSCGAALARVGVYLSSFSSSDRYFVLPAFIIY